METSMIKAVDRNGLQARLRANPSVVLLEALPEKYFNDWHLPRARHFPHDQARALAATVAPDKSAEIGVYCASRTCQNSHIAAKTLESLGYSNVAVYAGGKEDWREVARAE